MSAGPFGFHWHHLTSEHKQAASVIYRLAAALVFHCAVKRHDQGNRAVHFLGGFFLINLHVASRIGSNKSVIHVPSEYWMTTVTEFSLQDNAHQFLGRRTHIFEPLPKRNHGKAIILQVLNHHAGISAVIGNLADIVALIQLADELLDKAVVHHIAVCGHEVPLPLPHIVHNMVTTYAQ